MIPILVDVDGMAEILGVKKSWIYNQTMKSGRGLPCVRVGYYLRFEPEAVIAYLRKGVADEQSR